MANEGHQGWLFSGNGSVYRSSIACTDILTGRLTDHSLTTRKIKISINYKSCSKSFRKIAKDIISAVYQDIIIFIQDSSQHDDITMMVI
jgi:hypothetical protein